MNMGEDANISICTTQLPHQTQIWVGNEGDPASRQMPENKEVVEKPFLFFF